MGKEDKSCALGPTPELGGGVLGWAAASGFVVQSVRPLAGDLSPRRYARLRGSSDGGGSRCVILATYPAEARTACARFLASGALLAGAGVRVPEVYASDCEGGWMLLEDLGEATLAESTALPWSELGACFEDAVRLIGRVAALPREPVAALNPPLDGALMERELAQTWDLFLEPRGLVGDAALARDLQSVLGRICAGLGQDPPAPCHRDFMARNLMPLAGGRVAVLDHQDLRLGPPAYDLASLLNDTLFPPAELERKLLGEAVPEPVRRASYHRAAAQRTLKAVGSYASFARRGVPRHLPLISPTLGRFLAHLAQLPEGVDLAPDLARAWSAELGEAGSARNGPPA